MPAMHDGVGLAVSRSQPGPGAQLGGASEAVHVTDLGDEHRRQHRSDTRYLLDGLIAAISVELFGDQPGEPRLVAIEGIDEFQQRADSFGVQRLRTDPTPRSTRRLWPVRHGPGL